MASPREGEGLEYGWLHDWYDPSDHRPLEHTCVVEGCGFPAAFHLCAKHAVPGRVFEDGKTGLKFVIGAWVVERNGKHHVMVLNDCSLGTFFGGRGQFEKQLVSQGYAILNLVTNEREIEAAKVAYPDLTGIMW